MYFAITSIISSVKSQGCDVTNLILSIFFTLFKDIIPIEPDIFERHNLLILAKKITFGIPNNFNLPLITSDRNFQKDEYDYLRKLTDSYTESRYSYKYSFSDFKAAYEYIEIKRKLIIDKLFPDKQIDNINDNLGIHEEDDYII